MHAALATKAGLIKGVASHNGATPATFGFDTMTTTPRQWQTRLVIAAVGALLGDNCALARDIPKADFRPPSRFAAAPATPEAAITDPAQSGAWWTFFGDPALNTLIERMHAQNTSIRQAAARLSAANARARLGTASQTPFIGADASASQAGGPLINKAGGSGALFTGSVSISWEADLLGRFSGDRAAEKLDAKASEALFRNTRLLMEAETARAYFSVSHLRKALAEAKQSAALWHEREVIAAARMRNGLIQMNNLGEVRHGSLTNADAVAALERDLGEAQNRLAFLVGESEPIAIATANLPATPAIPAGLPSQVLQRRPDVEAAIAHLEAADQQLKSTRRSWFPVFSLTASGGAAAPSLGDILSSSAQNFGLGLLFSVPLLDGGRHKARVAEGSAGLDLAKAQYRETMLASLREVNDALGAVSTAEQQSRFAEEELGISTASVETIKRMAANGTASRAQTVEAQLELLKLRQKKQELDYRKLVGTVDLIKAIGGAWAPRSIQ